MRLLPALLVLAACGDGGGPAPGLDAADDAPDHSFALVFAATPGAPSYVAVRDGDDPWRRLVLDGAGHGEQRIARGFYSYLLGCPSADGGVRKVRVVHDVGAPPGPIAVCPDPFPPPALHLSGALAPDGAVVYAGAARAVVSGGHYTLAVAPGTYDVIATAAGRVVMRRGEAVTADRTLDLDFVAGFDLVPSPVTVTGADTVELRTELRTASGTVAVFPGGAATVGVVPVAERRPGDRLLAIATAIDPQGRRFRQHAVAGVAVEPFELLPAPVLYGDATGAIWAGDWDRVTYALHGETFGEGTLDVAVGAAWADRNHTDGAPVAWPDPVTLPGWDPSARVFQDIQLVRWTGLLEAGDRDGEWAAATDTGLLNW